MSGFANTPIGGTTLVRSAIKSPNFVTTVSGWTVNKNGTVEFNSGIFRGNVSVSNGTGQGWQLTANQLIALGSFKYSGGADGFLYAVPTTTTSGVSDLFIAGPTDLNLIPVITLNGESNDGTQLPQVGFTTFNNTSMVTSGLPLSLWNMLAVPPTPLNGPTIYAIGGHEKYKSTDANAYNTGNLHVFGAPGQLINTVTATNAITGASAAVGIGTYILDGVVWCTQGATASNQTAGVNGPAASTVNVEIDLDDTTGSATVIRLGASRLTTIGGRVGITLNAGTLPIAHTFTFRLRGYVTFTASGTFTLTASCSNATNTFTVNAFEFDLSPAT
jgi:hypothetical protein